MPEGRPNRSLFSPTYRRFLDCLKQARDDARLTQVEVASKLKRPQSYVSKCEQGERRVDVAEFLEFCEVYGVDAGDFLKQVKSKRRARRKS